MKLIKNTCRYAKTVLLNDPLSPQGVRHRTLEPREGIVVPNSWISEQARNLEKMNLLKISIY